jgi:hypothetical protein
MSLEDYAGCCLNLPAGAFKSDSAGFGGFEGQLWMRFLYTVNLNLMAKLKFK